VTRSRDDVVKSTVTTEAVMYPQRVPVNVYQTTGALVVVAPLPAVRASDVRVELHEGDPATLRFWAHVRSSPPREFLVHEWEYGGYERELELPAGFGSGVEATLNNGQLAVRVLRGDAVELAVTPTVQGSKPES
jgi:HSP20 family molecular chaperone IbpA